MTTYYIPVDHSAMLGTATEMFLKDIEGCDPAAIEAFKGHLATHSFRQVILIEMEAAGRRVDKRPIIMGRNGWPDDELMQRDEENLAITKALTLLNILWIMTLEHLIN